MGGDDSQKLLPWRGIHSSPGRKPPAQLRINNVTETAGWNLALTPPSLAGLAVASATGRLGHFWKAHPGQFWRAPKIKQHLRIKAFFGTTENAVKTQIWIAVSVYVLVAIVRKRMSLDSSLYQILQILSLTLFEKTPILQALQASDSEDSLLDDGNQLILFDF